MNTIGSPQGTSPRLALPQPQMIQLNSSNKPSLCRQASHTWPLCMLQIPHLHQQRLLDPDVIHCQSLQNCLQTTCGLQVADILLFLPAAHVACSVILLRWSPSLVWIPLLVPARWPATHMLLQCMCKAEMYAIQGNG